MRICITALLVFCASVVHAQKVITLYSGKVPGSETWDWQEAEMYSDDWQTRVVYNVSIPTLTVYLPPAATANGTAVILCPGGAFQALSIDSEGIDAAKWLNSKGVAAFVLKYRLIKSETNDPVKEVSVKMANHTTFQDETSRLIPLATADGLEAMKYVRKNSAQLNVNPRRIGIMGFSAGGTIATAVTLAATPESAPDFVAPIYAYIPPSMKEFTTPADAPPMFIAAATDDELALASHSIALYDKWLDARKPVEMHLYAKGGHGFGMRKKNFPSDAWIERFGDWMEAQGFLTPRNQQGKITPEQIWQRKKESEERFRNDWAGVSRYSEENKLLGLPKAGENRIVFMGNSITAGWINHRPDFFVNKPYVNRGISGQTTPQMLIRFKPDVIDLKPKVVVILAGINDIAQNTGPISLEAIMGNISGMALLAKAHGIRPILCSILPAFDFPWRPGLEPAQKVVTLNNMIKKFAHENNFFYVDYYAALVDSRNGMKKEYASDEVHPTPAGYAVMEPLVEKAITAVLRHQ
jgi:acetyl esterase/lipase/lysophospholipase L1-like esterase